MGATKTDHFTTTQNEIAILLKALGHPARVAIIEYLLNVHYSNGSGPWNTDNKCAIRSLTVNGSYAGVLVFPQRGKDEWSDWGFSNSRSVSLQQGENMVVISFEDWNNNMNVDVNTAMLDYLSVVRR